MKVHGIRARSVLRFVPCCVQHTNAGDTPRAAGRSAADGSRQSQESCFDLFNELLAAKDERKDRGS